MKRTRRCNCRKKRGGASMPMRYVDSSAILPSASAGGDMLRSMGQMIRQQIGGNKRNKSGKRNKYRTRKGGFIPSVMEGFVTATSKYIAPMAMYAAYKFVNRPSKQRTKQRTKRH